LFDFKLSTLEGRVPTPKAIAVTLLEGCAVSTADAITAASKERVILCRDLLVVVLKFRLEVLTLCPS
jgi:hypothetical protein